MADYKAIIKSADMSEDMQQDAIESTVRAIQTEAVFKDIAGYIKKDFDRRYGPTWHCITGNSFGTFVTHEERHYIYFFLDELAVLLFKSA
ncbi:unnamed protein product [Blepharisma stoltei]|uniref:Dynein light chain n=1 Tax=Blepharisma stoltei TaxID=1481888 RepID=A0AAU9JHQ9_9CILI|nr:unnamed protein product [Blepharisma stoltei]